MLKRVMPCLFLLAFFIPKAGCHPLGNFSLNHYTLLDINPQGILAQHVLDFAEIPSFSELANLDVDDNNKVSPAEIDAYKQTFEQRFLPNYEYMLESGGSAIPLQPQIIQRDVLLSYGQGGLTCIQIHLAVNIPLQDMKTGIYRLTFKDNNLTHVKGYREIRVKGGEGTWLSTDKIKAANNNHVAHLVDQLYGMEGLSVDMEYNVAELKPYGDANPVAVDRFIDPASIPPIPLEPDADGLYSIIKSPIQPKQEVQAQLSMLMPRTVTDASAALGGDGNGDEANMAVTAQISGEEHDRQTEKGDDEWSRLISVEDLSATFVITAILLSIFWGAVHALSPGHGKTVVAAYLIGSRGTVFHAIFLGVIVTLTHVSSVLVLGLIILNFQDKVVSESLYGLTESFSGLLIILIGSVLFFKRFSAYLKLKTAESLGVAHPPHHHHHHDHSHGHHHDHNHEHSHGHSHPHAHDHNHGHDHHHADEHHHDHDHPHPHTHDHAHPHDHEHKQVHEHHHHTSDHAHTHGHDHSHGHDHDHPHDHSHDHGHGHHHHHDHDHEHHHHHLLHGWFDDHEHGEHTHTHEIPADATWWDLLVLGVTGGIVPCPAAIVVLLVAIATHRVLFGLTLIVFFSVGLAVVLIAIGILMVKARPLFDRFEDQGKWSRALQIVSPVLVTILGFGILVRGLMTGGYISLNF